MGISGSGEAKGEEEEGRRGEGTYLTYPGLMQFTEIPMGAHSIAKALARMFTAPCYTHISHLKSSADILNRE